MLSQKKNEPFVNHSSLVAWQYPLTVTDEHLNRAKDAKAMVLNDDMLFMYPKYG